MKSRFTIKEVKKFVEDNSTCILLSNDYKNADSIVTLKCDCDNEFSVKFRYFKYQNKRMCDHCSDRKNGIVNSIQSAKDYVNTESGNTCSIVSTKYVDNKTPLKIKCACGSIFSCSIKNLRQKNSIQCNDCSHNAFRMTEEQLIELAKEAKCTITNISDYKNENSRLNFICNCGDEFSTSLASFKENKKRCNQCYRISSSATQRKHFDEIRSVVEGTGCKLVSSEEDYVNQYSNLLFECPCGKTFKRSYGNFVRRDNLCLDCTASKGEKAVAEILTLKGLNYEREYSFSGLYSKKGYPLRFDFAVMVHNEVKCLIEYDGEFHFEAIISEANFEYQKFNDELKNTYCKVNNIPLLRIPYYEYENMDNIIENFLSHTNTEVKHSLTSVAHRRA